MQEMLVGAKNQSEPLQRTSEARRNGLVRPLVNLIRRQNAERQRHEKDAPRIRHEEGGREDREYAECDIAVQIEERARHDVVRVDVMHTEWADESRADDRR